MSSPMVLALLVLLALCTLCSGTSAAASRGGICQECMEFTSQAEEFLSDPKNEEAAIHYAKTYACSSLPPNLKSKCQEMVYEYVPVVFATLQDYVSPQKMCVDTGLCKASEILSSPSDKKPWQGLASFAERACNRHCTSLKASLNPLCSFCTRVKRNNCAICKYLVLELKIKLHNPESRQKMVQFLMDNCQKLHNRVDECKLLVLEYAPLILANVDTFLEDSVCSKIGMCPNNPMVDVL